MWSKEVAEVLDPGEIQMDRPSNRYYKGRNRVKLKGRAKIINPDINVRWLIKHEK